MQLAAWKTDFYMLRHDDYTAQVFCTYGYNNNLVKWRKHYGETIISLRLKLSRVCATYTHTVCITYILNCEEKLRAEVVNLILIVITTK